MAIDLITRDENIRWPFHTDISTTLKWTRWPPRSPSGGDPDVERAELQQRPFASIEAGGKS
ncbi:hypothetical protein [Streptomyces atratus]